MMDRLNTVQKQQMNRLPVFGGRDQQQDPQPITMCIFSESLRRGHCDNYGTVWSQKCLSLLRTDFHCIHLFYYCVDVCIYTNLLL